MNTKSKTEHIPHSTQFELLTRKLLCLFSACGVIPSLSREEIEHYATLAGFHDIGKGTIPPEILDKPAPLTAEEFAVMKTHTTAGCKLLRESPEFSGSDDLPLLCDVCRHHHERWDGGGYPDGLSGNQITPWVQVVGMADAFDALLHPRVYKPAFPRAQAVRMIVTGACGTFCPDMAACFEQNIRGIFPQVYLCKIE